MTKWLAVLLACGLAGCAGAAKVESMGPGASTATTGDSLLARAKAIHRASPLVDGHNDLPWQLRTKGSSDFTKMDFRGSLPQLHTDLPRLEAGGVGAVFFAAYVPASFAQQGIAAHATIEQIDLIHRMVAHAPDAMEFAHTADDIERIHRDGKIAVLIGVEGGHAIENSLALLRQFYALGARYMTLAYETTDWADGCPPAPALHGGLAPFGVELVHEMNRLGMMVDLSHCSDDTMRDAIEASDAPVIFSHSSARALAADQPRDVPDDVLRMVRGNGGVVMVNFFSDFLLPEPPERLQREAAERKRLEAQFPADEDARRAEMRKWWRANPMPRGTVPTIADHIDHIRKIAGIDHVGLGSDFDGVSVLPEGMEDASCFPNLTAELLRRGYSDDDVKKVLGLNVLRVMRQAEEVAKQVQRERPPSMVTTQPATLLRDLSTTQPTRLPRDPAWRRGLPPSRPAAAR